MKRQQLIQIVSNTWNYVKNEVIIKSYQVQVFMDLVTLHL